ncbi:EAL domain-containing protein [Hansschlegelia quercus]|uniref:EAL domain-containing protein n=1 Tax=Hansschlegelia quercus TaxID=2528245 RepID=A0A4Q9GEH9_9HYPH|nr:EAL domain-containing protein [Hansschlegelia quercus]TBN47019.1 EAL domain-containing protein [Hansschlegelia quercus]
MSSDFSEMNARSPVPDDDQRRSLDAVCRLAAELFNVPFAFVSQLEAECQWFIGRKGLELSSTPRDIAFCSLTSLNSPHEPLVVLDTQVDPRFSSSPLVWGEPFLRFYAGVPIALGDEPNRATMCIADTSPRKSFGAEERRSLLDIAVFVESALRVRLAGSEAERAQKKALSAYEDLQAEVARRSLAEDTLRLTLDHMDQGLVMLDHENVVRISNRRAQILLDLPDELLRLGTPYEELHRALVERGAPEDLAREEGASSAADRLKALRPRMTWTRAGGPDLDVRNTPLPDGGRVLTFTDVSEQRAAEKGVQESEKQLRLIAENANDVIVLGDLNMQRLYVSPSVRTVLGYEPEEIIGTRPQDLAHPEDIPLFQELWSRVFNGKGARVVEVVRHRHKAGHYVWVEASVRLARDPKSDAFVGYVAALRDVTDRRNAEEKIRHMALHDPLTELPNRTLFRDRLRNALAHAARSADGVAVLACDVDRFKAVNDSFGHMAGDTLLRIVADRMSAVLRPYDTLARLGGDEFVVVLGYLNEYESAAGFAERLIAAVSEPVHIDGHMVEVGLSVGITISTNQADDVDEVFKRADMALYEAKAAGRGAYRSYNADTGARIAARSQLGLDMKEAVRRGDYRLVYQPVIDLKTGLVVSCEALMRWSHPTRGEVSPAEFIPLAEETGLIVPLGTWALREACREARNWPEGVKVAVNVSGVQLRRGGVEAAVLEALTLSGLPPQRLKLEVTESVLLDDGEAILESLHRLRQRGVAVALDDFGTGYSSLSYLRRFPFDKIKLDRAFIKDIADPDAAAIVRAVVGIGERLGMGIVAEGVETAEQLELVRQEGCQQVQGFFFSRPLPPKDMQSYLNAAYRSRGRPSVVAAE